MVLWGSGQCVGKVIPGGRDPTDVTAGELSKETDKKKS